MGGSSSKPEQTNETPFCEDCQKDKQQPLPSRDNISADGKPCAVLYDLVESCMKNITDKSVHVKTNRVPSEGVTTTIGS